MTSYRLQNMLTGYQVARHCGRGRFAAVAMVAAAVLTNFFCGPYDARRAKEKRN